MYARVWKISLLPENVQRFAAACRAVGEVNKTKPGYCGLLVLRGGPLDSPDTTVVSLWDSLETLRASESETFHKAVAAALACALPGAVLREEEILVSDLFAAKHAAVKKKMPKPRKKKRARRAS